MTPVLHLAAAPSVPAQISDLFRSDDIRRIIENPPVSRQHGFNILTYERAQIVDGERLVIGAWRKHLELYKDGTFIALGTFPDLLGWPRDRSEFELNPKINPLALIEFTYDFFNTYEAILDHLAPLPVSLRCNIGIEGAFEYEHHLWMTPYGIKSVDFEFPNTRHSAPSDSISHDVEVTAQEATPHTRPGEITYSLVEFIYNWFGLTSDTMPYALHDSHQIDPGLFAQDSR